MNSDVLIQIGGVYNLLCAILHIFFPVIFQWEKVTSYIPEEFRRLTVITMHLLNGCLLAFFLIFAYISIMHSGEIINSRLGTALMTSIALFWLLRSAVQVFLIGGLMNRSYPLKVSIPVVSALFFFIAGMSLYLIPLINIL